MSAIVPTIAQPQFRSFFRNLGILAIAPVLFFAACSSSDDGGGGAPPNNNPPAATAQNAYVVSGISEIQAYKLDAAGNLTKVGAAINTGVNPHHVNVDPAGRFVYVSNHDSPFLSGWRINPDASLAPMVAQPGSPVTGSDPTENQPHWSVLDQTGQYLYVVAGTGASTLRAYRVTQAGNDLGMLTFISGQSFPVGTHAHNVTISPNNQFLYVASDVSGELRAFSRNTADGTLTPQGVTALGGVETVAVEPQSKFVYASFPNAVKVFSIGATGALTEIAPPSTFETNNTGTGSGPHSLAIRPGGQTLYTSNINSNTITVFRMDAGTGALSIIQNPFPATGLEPNQVVVHPNGQFVFTTDTNNDQLSRFAVNADGTLVTPATVIPAGDGAQGMGITKF